MAGPKPEPIEDSALGPKSMLLAIPGLPGREVRVAVIAARGLDAVATVARGGHRRPVRVVAGALASVHRQRAAAGEVAAVTTVNDRRGLVANRSGADVVGLVRAIDGEVDGIRAQTRAGAAGRADHDLGLVVGRQGTITGGQPNDVGPRRREGGGGGRGVGRREGDRAGAAGLAPGDSQRGRAR